jgi:hypothetical protein
MIQYPSDGVNAREQNNMGFYYEYYKPSNILEDIQLILVFNISGKFLLFEHMIHIAPSKCIPFIV